MIWILSFPIPRFFRAVFYSTIWNRNIESKLRVETHTCSFAELKTSNIMTFSRLRTSCLEKCPTTWYGRHFKRSAGPHLCSTSHIIADDSFLWWLILRYQKIRRYCLHGFRVTWPARPHSRRHPISNVKFLTLHTFIYLFLLSSCNRRKRRRFDVGKKKKK